MVPAGTTLDVAIRGTAGGWTGATIDGVRNAIVSALNGYFRVRSCTVQSEGSWYELMQFQFTAKATVITEEAYGAVEDAYSVIAHAVYEATGYMPTVDGPGTQDASENSGGGWVDGFVGNINELFSGLGNAAGNAAANATKPLTDELNTILIVVAVVAVVLVVSVGGKTTRIGL